MLPSCIYLPLLTLSFVVHHGIFSAYMHRGRLALKRCSDWMCECFRSGLPQLQRRTRTARKYRRSIKHTSGMGWAGSDLGVTAPATARPLREVAKVFLVRARHPRATTRQRPALPARDHKMTSHALFLPTALARRYRILWMPIGGYWGIRNAR